MDFGAPMSPILFSTGFFACNKLAAAYAIIAAPTSYRSRSYSGCSLEHLKKLSPPLYVEDPL